VPARKPEAIDGAVSRDHLHPGGQRAAGRVELLRTIPEGKERFLNDLRGHPAIVADPQGGREDQLSVSVVEACERVLGPLDELTHQAHVGR
jgi:hypothetical protein